MATGKFIFSDEEKAQIKAAVKAAETKTSGEIVPYFIDSSDDYEIATLKGTLVFFTTALLIAGSLSYLWVLPFPVTILEIIIFTMGMGLFGFLISRFIQPIKRLWIPRHLMELRVQQRARIAFLEEEVFNTENRTGILIFVSHFEHQVEVIGDSGINAKVKKEEWEAVVQLIVNGIKRNDTVDGLVNGIRLCGELLEREGFIKPPENPNELSDDIRLG